MKNTLQFFGCIAVALGLGIIAGHMGGYTIMYLDEWETNRTIK